MNRKLSVLFIAVIIGVAGMLSAQSADNLIRNGDLSEKGNDGAPSVWNIGKDNQPWTLDAPSEMSGGKPALTFTVKAAQANYGAVEQSVKNLKKNTRYTLEAHVLASKKEVALLMIKLFDASGKELKRYTGGFNTGTDPELLRLVFNTEEAAGVSVLCRYLQNADSIGARISFSDIKLYEKKIAAPRLMTIYVSPSGKNGANGTKETPLKRIQEALDKAGPGTTVHLASGVYRERIRFNEGGIVHFPVTLEGESGAVIDASDPLDLNWVSAADIGPGVYKTSLTTPVITVTADGKIVTILDEKRVDPDYVAKVLAKGKNKEALGVVPENVFTADWAWPAIFQKGIGPSGWEGVKALAIYSEKRKELIIRFKGDLDPRTMRMTVARRLPAITISGADRCVVRGLTIRNGWQGVLIERSLGSVVEDCRIEITDHGVYLGPGADRCTIRFNDISQDPYAGASPKMTGWWDNWLAHKVGGFYDRIGIEIHATIGGHVIHDNDIHDDWDGIEDTGKVGENRDLDIHHNRIFRVADDGLEPNGAGENCRWHDNWVEETCCGFRIKTIKAGPLYAYRNIFFNNGEDYRCFVPQYPAEVYVYHNTSTSAVAVTYNKVQGIGTPKYWFLNNIFWCERWWSGGDLKPNWHGEHNIIVRRGANSDWDKKKSLAAELGIDQKSLWLEGDPGFMDAEKKDARLREDSPARGRGGDMAALTGKKLPGFESAPNVSDAGALRYGDPLPIFPRKRGTFDVPAAGSFPAE
ncbi:MAG: right-handed parallel beta-helix repeat-containing protein [Spirochaetes bacterium]|nr:right-handed parallel beta-helix repeat-containing protein [Spirochaetota bacterium]